MSELRTLIGRVTSVNPAKREIRVTPIARRVPDISGVETVYVAAAGQSELACKTAAIRMTSDQIIVELAPGVLRDTVASFRNGAVSVDSAGLRPVDTPEFEGESLLGFYIETADHGRIGRVAAVMDTPAHDVLEIETPGGGSILAPLVEEWIDRIDWDKRVIFANDMTAFAVHQEPDPTTRLV